MFWTGSIKIFEVYNGLPFKPVPSFRLFVYFEAIYNPIREARMRFSRWISILLMGAALCALDMADVFAQRGGGRGRGGGADLRPGQRGQYEDFPWEARKLLEANGQILSQMPAPIRVYILDQAKKWDDLFPVRQQQLELFFRKIPNTARPEFNAVFGDVLREFQGLQGGAQGRRGQGARRGGRGSRVNLAVGDLTPAQYAMIERAFQSFVLPDQGLPKGLVIFAITGSDSESHIPAYLTHRGVLFDRVAYDNNPRDWMGAVQTASPNAIKGKNLAAPSLFEYHNKAIEDKSHTRTLAFYQSGDKDIPPTASKTKGYGDKYSPFAVNAPSLKKIAAIIEEELGTAVKQGKSQRYIDRMVKPKLTPEALKLKKVIKDEAFGRLVSGVLMDNEESRKLGGAFIAQVTRTAMHAALPDVLFVEIKAGDVSADAIAKFHDTLSAMARYGSGATFALFDQPSGQALLVSPKIIGGQSFEGQSLENISATMAKAAGLSTDATHGTPIASVKMR